MSLSRRMQAALFLIFLFTIATSRLAQSADLRPAPLLSQMAGNWTVESRMWPGPDAKPVNLPAATARRELVNNAFLQEVMEPANGAGLPFTRVAYVTYNDVNQQYEYFSLDTRLPQMMAYVTPGANRTRNGNVEFAGGSFVAPEWGPRKNVPFMYRLSVGPVEGNRQLVQLFLREQGTANKEFLAFEYVYTRR